MYIRLQGDNSNAKPLELHGLNNVVIYDDQNNPILVLLKMADGVIWTKGIGDSDFKETLAQIGLPKRKTQTVTIEQLQK